MRRPEGFQSLEDLVVGRRSNDQVAMPAAWLCGLLAYARELEQTVMDERDGVAELGRLDIVWAEDVANR